MFRFWILSLILLAVSCTDPGGKEFKEGIVSDKTAPYPNYIDWKLSASQIAERCQNARTEIEAELGYVATSERPTFANTIARLDRGFTKYMNDIDYLDFYRYVLNDADLKAAAKTCSDDSQAYLLKVFAREDLYKVVKEVAKTPQNNPIDQRLVEDYLYDFESNGLALPPAKKKALLNLKEKLIKVQSDYAQTLNDWHKEFHFTKKQLDGLPEGILKGLDASKENGKDYILTLKYPHIYPALTYVKDASVREKMYRAFKVRGGEGNRKLLAKAVEIRLQIAQLLGFASFAEFRLKKRMAKNPTKVQTFLTELRGKLRSRTQQEFRTLRQLKQRETGSKNLPVLNPWDVSFYSNILKEETYKVDEEEIKQYFEVERTVDKMLVVYQTLLGVTFRKTNDVATWHEDVRAFRIYDSNSGHYIATFFMDLFPREGKYGHAAAFTLINGYEREDGRYQSPVSAAVANFNKPSPDTPALLTHGQVETLFHEFGHIMHQTLTTSKYGSFSGTSVMRDFVEAPSQMLENWVWDRETLTSLGAHYKTGKAMPDELIDRLLASRKVNKAIHYTRQNFYASIDMAYHTVESTTSLDTTALYHKLYHDINMLDEASNSYPEASFGHLMGGYEAGYYGYMWSEVYAQDMFTRFKNDGLLNQETGADYRRLILEPGGTEDPMELITKFLGRDPNQEAFLSLLGTD